MELKKLWCLKLVKSIISNLNSRIELLGQVKNTLTNQMFTDFNSISNKYFSNNDVNKDKKKIKATIRNDDVISLTDKTYKNDVIELMFVIDTTGSMGDEIKLTNGIIL